MTIAIPMDPLRWTFDSWSTGMPRHPLADGVSWMFSFPPRDGVHYLTCRHGNGTKWNLTGLSSVTVVGAIDQVGDVAPAFTAVDGGTAACRLILERAIDVDRYWSNPMNIALVPSAFSVTVPLAPDQWSNVNGQPGTAHLTAFNGMKSHCGIVGLTFGGMFFGHGVFCSAGKADFRCRSYTFV